MVEDTDVTLSLSSMEGLQIRTPQTGSSGLPIPSREVGLTAWVRAFKFLKWWRTPASPSRSLRWKDYRPEPQSQSNNHIFRPLRMAIRFFYPHIHLLFFICKLCIHLSPSQTLQSTKRIIIYVIYFLFFN